MTADIERMAREAGTNTAAAEAAMRVGFADIQRGRLVFINDKMGEMLVEFAALVRAQEQDRWIRKAGAVYTQAHAVFNNPPSETPQEVRDVIEWHLYSMRHDEIEELDAATQATAAQAPQAAP